MSHLLSNPIQKPYLFELPRPAHPLTPPDTDNEFNGQPYPSAPVHSTLGADPDSAASHVSAVETPTAFYRRPSSFAYINSGPREARERTPQRSFIKWLVVVIPPPSFSREHGQFGHTLSLGSPSRLSQGLLMPLFPTMGSQLGAIAREFNLPSTAGLCLYLHTAHNGIALYPRISDESWHLLWAHLFEARSPAPSQQQMPISGQIEFDIDLAKARWYDAWLSSRREFADVPHSVSHSRRPSMTHWRGDSRTSFVDEQADDQLDSISVLQQSRVAPNAPRLGPRKLSLLDRFDTSSVISGARPRHLSPNSPTEETQLRALSPIVQEEEPKTARKDIDTLVHSWRATASVVPSPLATTGQTSLDPANMPNTLGDLPSASTHDDHYELNLDDYAWSVSSAGPPEYDDYDDDAESVVWRLPSPDIARRVMSDAPPTPATATSWGAPLSYPPSPLDDSSFYAPSVDIAGRAMYSRPVTPATATSWGAPSYPASPAYNELTLRVPSPDIAARGMLSLPPTPSTATSWGPSSSYPVTPAHSEFRVPSPDLGARGMLSVPASPLPVRLRQPAGVAPQHDRDELGEQRSPSSELVFPYYRAPGQAWSHVWPYEVTHNSPLADQHEANTMTRLVFPYYGVLSEARNTSVQGSGSVDAVGIPPSSPLTFPYYSASQKPWSHVWPYQHVSTEKGSTDAMDSPTWRQVWPYAHAISNLAYATNDALVDGSRSSYPYFNLYPAVYPNFDFYPSTLRVAAQAGNGQVSVQISGRYPTLTIYPAVYPHFDIYPSTIDATSRSISEQPSVHVHLSGTYPVLTLYPAVYPNFDIYPSVARVTGRSDNEQLQVHLSGKYPIFSLYPAVYPHFEIYPSNAIDSARAVGRVEKAHPSGRQSALSRRSGYPVFELYPAAYPHFDIYPATTSKITYAHERAARTHSAAHVSVLSRRSEYPTFELYPAVYPWNLSQIYPPSRTANHETSRPLTKAVAVRLATAYPFFNLYPAVYPLNLGNIYPVVKYKVEKVSSPGAITAKLPVAYPRFEIYPNVYPHNLRVYPAVANGVGRQAELIVKNSLPYPYFDLYPAVYPHNLFGIYPTKARPERANGTKISDVVVSSVVKIPTSYPAVVPYEAVYPWSVYEIYPPVGVAGESLSESTTQSVSVLLDAPYPVFKIYPAVYPHNLVEIYPCALTTGLRPALHTALIASYPILDIYPAVYPHSLAHIYPPISSHAGQRPDKNVQSWSPISTSYRTTSSELTMSYPYICPYPNVYPFLAVYPQLPQDCVFEAHSIKPKAMIYPAFDIYPALYPHFQIYPSVWRVDGDDAVPAARAITSTSSVNPVVSVRRRPRYTHLELHQQFFATASINHLTTSPAPTVQDNSVPAISRARSRAGTVSMRPSVPPKPTSMPYAKAPLPSIPSGNSSAPSPSSRLSVAPAPRRPVSTIGLPSHPAANRRMSTTLMKPISSASSSLPTVVEPEEPAEPGRPRRASPRSSLESPGNSRPMRRIDVDVPLRGVHAAQSNSATLPSKPQLLEAGADLSRSKTLPSSTAGLRERRASAVLQKAKAYDQSSTDDSPVRITMSTLAEFPTPPRPPLPPLPNGRPVSKLDRSKYPFA